MALQRKNFRRDEGLVSRYGSTGSGSLGVVVSHAELPPRQRKRVQVGSTNLTRSVSTPELPAPSSVQMQIHDESSSSSAVLQICETNVALLKQSMKAASAAAVTGKTKPLVVLSDKQLSREPLLQSKQLPERLAPHTSETSDRYDGDTRPTTKVSQLPAKAQASSERALLLLRTRNILYDAFVDRYGSVRAVFRAFDRDANGSISFQRFADMVEASQVELSRDDVRRVFQQVDANADNAIEFQEFSEMFTASADAEHESAYSPTRNGVTPDIPSSLTLKFRAPLELSPRTRERMKTLRLQVNAELRRKHGRDLGVHGDKPENLLMYAFKHLDTDNDGFLSYDQVQRALGRDYLQLSLETDELREMLRLVDRNADDKISMKEFVQYFGAGLRELPTDFIDNGRRKELAALHFKANAALTPRDQVDPAYFERTRVGTIETMKALPSLETGGCMQQNLLQRIATSPVFRTRPHDGHQPRAQTSPAVLSKSQSTPTVPRAKNDYVPTLNPLATVSQDRFLYWREQRTDWSRVGVGGDGVRPDAALFASDADRLTTTTRQEFSPMHRGVHSGDVFRDHPSTSEMEAHARASQRQARHAHTEKLLREMETQRAQEQRLVDWKQRAKVRLDAERRFVYLDKIHDQEQRVAMREIQMAKRHGGVRFHRMWAGSADSQFNNAHVTDRHSSGGAELQDCNQ